MRREAWQYDLFFVDSLSTCVPILRALTGKRVIFYCHFPDKVLSMGTYAEDGHRKKSTLKRLYRAPVDILEEFTTGTESSDN
jgi:alpha-1,3/alpha-1,6-mannosyltransferase